MPIQLRSPAKLNLTLAVLNRRPDGFHNLHSHILKLDWCDEILLEPADRLGLRLEGPACAGVPVGPENLVIRAAERLAAALGRPPEVAITLAKHLPHGAGLGGGSSNAATVLLGLQALWRSGLSDAQLAEIGADLGSDVPLFLRPSGALIEGRGDRVTDWASPWSGLACVIVPRFGLSTPAVYGACKPRDASRPESPWCGRMTARQFMQTLYNDLESAAFEIEPRLQEIQQALSGVDDRIVRMTGSGSALFTLFDRQDEAEQWRISALSAVGEPVTIHIAQSA